MLSLATTLQQPTTYLTLHAHQNALHTHHYSSHYNKHKAYLCKWWQNGTRCRHGVKVLWCHSHLVWLIFDASIPTCTCFPSENFCDLYMYMWLSCAEIKDFSVVYYNCITTFISSSSPGHQKCALPNTFILLVLG